MRVQDPALKHHWSTINMASTYGDFEKSQGKLAVATYFSGQVGGEANLISGPRTLYHYSGKGGAEAIMLNQSMWATDARYLNDERELGVAGEILRRQLEDNPPVHGSSEAEFFAYSILEQVAQDSNFYTSPDAARVFITCFTSRKSSLGLWRGYGHGSLGYSMGYPFELVKKLYPDDWPGTSSTGVSNCLRLCGKVSYLPGHQEDSIRDFRRAMQARLAAIHDDPASQGNEHELVRMVRRLMTILDVFFKDAAWQEEDEFRYAIIDFSKSLKTQTRETTYGFAEYLTLRSATPDDYPFAPTSLDQGPTSNPDAHAKEMEEWLQQNRDLWSSSKPWLNRLPIVTTFGAALR
ncbi:DUF2971 domain-containing protein [Kineococcus sp. SYSU DK005]|uniref:DUF2971 domain-containing protein n=1 Tax=Kineococcus sp. SYSU DK005 TaxID=3383126 RepID=UPI003D7D5249